MESPVFLLRTKAERDDIIVSGLIKSAIKKTGLFDEIKKNDFTAVKTHFGETVKSGHPRPAYLKAVAEELKEKGAAPFMTETSTLYKGNRTDAVKHLLHAHSQGFTPETTGMPVIMADGLIGDEETDIEISGKYYSSVKIASLFLKIQYMVVVSHFTGHLAAGFGASIKNLGMGCASRRGKMVQHSTSKPKIKEKKCTRCGQCMKWCPGSAITVQDNEAYIINRDICIGCGQCLAVCRFDAVKYNWGSTYEDLQKKIAEHAAGVISACEGRIVYITLLTRISKDCDCMDVYEEIAPDIGILLSRDPVAIDSASIDLVEKAVGKKFSETAYDIPCRTQISHAAELGLGTAEYRLVEL